MGILDIWEKGSVVPHFMLDGKYLSENATPSAWPDSYKPSFWIEIELPNTQRALISRTAHDDVTSPLSIVISPAIPIARTQRAAHRSDFWHASPRSLPSLPAAPPPACRYLIYCLDQALASLPNPAVPHVYRGVGLHFDVDGDYREHAVVCWPAFSSSSASQEVRCLPLLRCMHGDGALAFEPVSAMPCAGGCRW